MNEDKCTTMDYFVLTCGFYYGNDLNFEVLFKGDLIAMNGYMYSFAKYILKTILSDTTRICMDTRG